MESGQEKVVSHCSGTVSESLYAGVDRRQFLQYAASVGAVLGLSRSAFGQMTADQKDNRLPNGTEHVSWEQPLNFSKTYYVDNGSSKADDNGPGSSARPFRTINKAAQILQPGERVVIASGIYRECVHPVRGGTSAAQMISYEAAPGAKVVVKGSDVLKDGWQQESVAAGRGTPVTQIQAWRHDLTAAMFPDAYNPFALASAPGDREWLDTKMIDMGPYFRRRGLVFVDGKPLEPMEQLRELAIAALPGPPPPDQPQLRNGLPPRTRTGPIMQEIGGTLNGRFWVDNPGTAVHVRLPEGTPADHLVEVTTREQVFVPLNKGLAFIRVKGITFQHAGNGYPVPQRGLVSTAGGNHWIIEGNTIEWANGVGLDIANGDWNASPTPQAGLNQIVRGNTIRYCGVEGIGGMGTVDTVVEDNLIEWCGWADVERAWEAAAAKFHRAHNMLFRRNVIRHIRHANAVWFDSGNLNNRITGNVFADVLTVSAAVHIEVNLEQNQVDNNIIWDVRNAEPGTPGQRGCAGSGVFINASNRLILAQNLIGRCDNSGVFAIIREDRAGTGTATENKIYNNIFSSCGKSAIVFLNQNNEADGNVYASMPKDFLGFTTHNEKQWLDLPAWRSEHGWDKHGATADMQIGFDPDRLELTLIGDQALTKVATFNSIETDIFGKHTGDIRLPGPVADPEAKSVWKVDPRSVVT
jgi:Right handed beta helix region